jgi:hypothetical protein
MLRQRKIKDNGGCREKKNKLKNGSVQKIG